MFSRRYCKLKEELLDLKNQTYTNDKDGKQKIEKAQDSEKLLMYGHAMNTIATLLFTASLYANTKEFGPEYLGSLGYIIWLFLQFLRLYFTFYNGITSSVELLICELMTSLIEILKDWQESFNSDM